MIWHRHHENVRCFARDTAHHESLAQHYAGIQSIPVHAIVGSVGRSHELGVDFLPLYMPRRTAQTDCRYRSILGAMRQGVTLPAIEVYELGNMYYVLDGNHRVAAALATGQLYIDAVVTAFEPVRLAALQAA